MNYAKLAEGIDIRRDPSPMHIHDDGYASLCGIPARQLTRSVAFDLPEARMFLPDSCAACAKIRRSMNAKTAEAASHPAAPEGPSPDGSDSAGGVPR